ncbi:MAG TPA: hypothetical protein VGM90_39115 [Kofleriaceae bacterium]|jgi:hypothetical protein
MTVLRASLFMLALALPSVAHADADWSDTETLFGDAMAKVDPVLLACHKAKTPLRIPIAVVRDAKTGSSRAGMPLPAEVGILGLTPEDRCLMKESVAIALPPLPAEVEELWLGHTVGAAPSPFGEWRDLPAALAKLLDGDHRQALGACGAKTMRLVLDERHGKTRIWLPAWQFHSASGDGTTPAAQQVIKRCLTRAISAWIAPAFPTDLGEIHLAIRFK